MYLDLACFLMRLTILEGAATFGHEYFTDVYL